MFPEIRAAFKEWRDTRSAGLTTLGIEQKAGGYGIESYARNGFYDTYAKHINDGPSASGQQVTTETAQNHSVVWACQRTISESIAFMALDTMRVTAGGKFPATDHPMYRALRNAPNDDMTAMGFRETLTGHCVLGGNCYAQIFRRSGTNVAYELYPLLPTQVTPTRDAARRLVYIVKEGNLQAKTYTVERGKPHDILHVRGLGDDGTRGYSVITVGRHSIGTAKAAEMYAAKFYAAGGRTPWVMEMAQKFDKKYDGDKFSADFNRFLSDQNNWHKGIVLEPGMTYKNMGMSPEESQFLETRLFEIPEICRWFLISPYMVGELSRATFSNVEHLALQFVKMTLTAWMTRWEKELWRCVLTPAEKDEGLYFRHNANGLLRGDFQTRMAGYATALQNGFKNIDQIRDLEDENPLPSGAGQAYHIQMNMATVPGTGTPMVAEQGILDRMAASSKKALEQKEIALPQIASAPSVINVNIEDRKQAAPIVNVAAPQIQAPPAPVNIHLALNGKRTQTVKRNEHGLIENIETVDLATLDR